MSIDLYMLDIPSLMIRVSKVVAVALTIFILYSTTTFAEEKFNILASIQPVASIVEEVVGSSAVVSTLTGKGTDPHTFELTPSKIEMLNKADVIVFSGLGIEFWGDAIGNETKRKIILLSDALSSKEGDMHTWLDPLIVSTEALYLADKLCEIYVSHCDEFKRRATIYSDSLNSLHNELKARIQTWQSKTFVSLHPSWTRFAERYSLLQIGSVRSNDHQILGTKSMVELLSLIKTKDAKAVVVTRGEEQPGIVISQASSLPVIILDEYNSANQTLLQLIKKNVDTLESVLK